MASAGPGRAPRHVGVVMDGNRRWAERELGAGARLEGHRRGAEALTRLCEAAAAEGLEALSVYAFSTENWGRGAEVAVLLALAAEFVSSQAARLDSGGVRVLWSGTRDPRIPAELVRAVDALVGRTAGNARLTLNVCFSYGGRREIVDAANACLAERGGPLTEEGLSAHLYQPSLPPLDLVVRTGGERRLSNFLLWQAAYAELYFTDALWPDFGPAGLRRALEDYAARSRRFGA